MEDHMTIFEINPEYLYLIILGDKNSIKKIIHDMDNSEMTSDCKYFAIKIDDPLANKCDELLQKSDEFNKPIIIDDGTETAQCHTYAEGYNKNMYMLATLRENDKYFVLGYPKFDLDESENPEIVVEEWFDKRMKKKSSSLKKNMRFVTVVGERTNILVMTTKIHDKK